MVGDDDGETSDNNQGSGTAPPLALANQNIVAAARNYGQRKRLRSEQLTELDVFLNVGHVNCFLAQASLTSD
jgi:hypothetical protein